MIEVCQSMSSGIKVNHRKVAYSFSQHFFLVDHHLRNVWETVCVSYHFCVYYKAIS